MLLYPVAGQKIIYHGCGYKEPRYLIVPERSLLSTEEIVGLYAKRMCIGEILTILQ
ncbi:MAG: hypothetical protein A4E57_03653 [Syntrophorhabdaceae bacterium PtaU1.Bin034]|jgi:hypothetical protein|nr:MAG: hypothetical protein A4E57_03653 [Syntrophorhabdaceae bacterium PtaU1.Bin034]